MQFACLDRCSKLGAIAERDLQKGRLPSNFVIYSYIESYVLMEREQRTQTKDGAREKTSRRRYLIIFLDHRPRQLHWLHAPRYPAAKGVGQRLVPVQADSGTFCTFGKPKLGRTCGRSLRSSRCRSRRCGRRRSLRCGCRSSRRRSRRCGRTSRRCSHEPPPSPDDGNSLDFVRRQLHNVVRRPPAVLPPSTQPIRTGKE